MTKMLRKSIGTVFALSDKLLKNYEAAQVQPIFRCYGDFAGGSRYMVLRVWTTSRPLNFYVCV
jgi:hypothetical protein